MEAAVRSTADLVRIAQAAKASGAQVTFSGLNVRPTAELVRIGQAGAGVVVLEG